MTQTPEFQIRETVAAYLAGEFAFADFELRFLELSWGTGDPDAAELAGRVDLSIAEYTGGYLDEDGLRAQLRPIVTEYRTHAGPQSFDTSSTLTPVAA